MDMGQNLGTLLFTSPKWRNIAGWLRCSPSNFAAIWYWPMASHGHPSRLKGCNTRSTSSCSFGENLQNSTQRGFDLPRSAAMTSQIAYGAKMDKTCLPESVADLNSLVFWPDSWALPFSEFTFQQPGQCWPRPAYDHCRCLGFPQSARWDSSHRLALSVHDLPKAHGKGTGFTRPWRCCPLIYWWSITLTMEMVCIMCLRLDFGPTVQPSNPILRALLLAFVSDWLNPITNGNVLIFRSVAAEQADTLPRGSNQLRSVSALLASKPAQKTNTLAIFRENPDSEVVIFSRELPITTSSHIWQEFSPSCWRRPPSSTKLWWHRQTLPSISVLTPLTPCAQQRHQRRPQKFPNKNILRYASKQRYHKPTPKRLISVRKPMVWVFGTNLYTSELTQKGCLQSFVAAVQPYNSLRLSNIESGLTTVVFPAPMICFTPLSAVSSFNCWKSEMATCRSCNILLSENLARSQVIRDCTAVAVEAATKSVRNTTKKREKKWNGFIYHALG